jgi:hypothetical protein
VARVSGDRAAAYRRRIRCRTLVQDTVLPVRAEGALTIQDAMKNAERWIRAETS